MRTTLLSQERKHCAYMAKGTPRGVFFLLFLVYVRKKQYLCAELLPKWQMNMLWHNY